MTLRELSPQEAEVLDLYLEFLGEGHPPENARRAALAALPYPDPEFVTWLAASH
jgi:hypothetical protein